MRRAGSIILLPLLLVGLLSATLTIREPEATGTIYIRADGSIDPPTAPIQRNGELYTLTGNITSNYDGIVIEKDNVAIDGAGYMLRGTRAYPSHGVDLTGRTNITVQNTQIDNFTYGIMLHSSSNNSISENTITANGLYGIHFSSAFGNNVSGNVIANNEFGLRLEDSSYNTIVCNTLTANHDGALSLSLSSDFNTIVSNSVANNTAGFGVGGSSNTIDNNTFTNDGLTISDAHQESVAGNTVNGLPLVYLEGVSNCTVNDAGQVILVRCDSIQVEGLNLSRTTVGVKLCYTGNSTISCNNITNNRCGVSLDHSSDNTIAGNNLAANEGGGVILDYSSDNIISGNSIENSREGLYLHGSSNNTVTGNNITGNSRAGVLLVYFCKYNIFAGNSITENNYGGKYYGGISVLGGGSSNTIIAGNNITANSNGIEIGDSSNSIVVGNTVANNGDGIMLDCCSSSIIACNSIADNDYGLHLYSSGNSLVYHNSLINNTVQLCTSPLSLVDALDGGYPSGGNYWSDYADADVYKGPHQNETGSDGIWDHPYVIDELNLDAYPLTAPFGGGLTGDVDCDHDVDIFDIVRLAGVYGVTHHDPQYNWQCDMNLDGAIDIFDLVKAAGNYGESW